jgi:phosphoribosylaminoimidazole-succinocarboxamide synthase
MGSAQTVLQTSIEELPLVHRGKVRDVYEIDEDRLLLVATDRLSAFDVVFPTPIPMKGKVLTSMSAWWFRKFGATLNHHYITADFDEMPAAVKKYPELRGRSMLVRKAEVFEIECVVRGYLEGSGWKDYKANRNICGHDLPKGLQHCDKLLRPIFTPSTKAKTGHDENISQMEMVKTVGHDIAAEMKATSIDVYSRAAEYALTRGIIIADTKFEFGRTKNGEIIMVDEILTPDSSRFWDAQAYEPGHPQPSFDKQFVREYLESIDWNKEPPAPELPPEIVEATTQRYLEAYKRLTGEVLPQD